MPMRGYREQAYRSGKTVYHNRFSETEWVQLLPEGRVGLEYSGLLALLLGKAMLDTRGLGWSWIIHLTIDTVLSFFFAASVL
jgi:hypothetical protein